MDYDFLDKDGLSEKLSTAKEAFVFVHGFQTPFKSAAFRAAQMKVDANFEGQALIFTWPSSQVPNYTEARDNAEKSRTHLKEFLELVRASTDAQVVHIIAHSMDNFALLDVLAELQEANDKNEPIFGELIFAAPDVNKIEFVEKTSAIRGVGRGMTLYASSADLAMYFSRQVCQIVQVDSIDCAPRAGGHHRWQTGLAPG